MFAQMFAVLVAFFADITLLHRFKLSGTKHAPEPYPAMLPFPPRQIVMFPPIKKATLTLRPRNHFAVFEVSGIPPPSPTFEKEGHPRRLALVSYRPNPVRIHRPCSRPCLATEDNGIDLFSTITQKPFTLTPK